MSTTPTTSKPIVATKDALDLTEAYALLRQVKTYLADPAPRPRASDDVRGAVYDFCRRFDERLHRKQSPAHTPETAAPPESPTGVLSQNTGAAVPHFPYQPMIPTTEF